MTDTDYERMLDAVRKGTGIVVLDTEPPHSTGSLKAAREIADDRLDRIRRGDRVAWLYPPAHRGEFQPNHDRDWQLCIGVTREQAQRLVAAGAMWIGHEVYAP